MERLLVLRRNGISDDDAFIKIGVLQISLGDIQAAIPGYMYELHSLSLTNVF